MGFGNRLFFRCHFLRVSRKRRRWEEGVWNLAFYSTCFHTVSEQPTLGPWTLGGARSLLAHGVWGGRLMGSGGSRPMGSGGSRLMGSVGSSPMGSWGSMPMGSGGSKLMGSGGSRPMGSRGRRLMGSGGSRLMVSGGRRFIFMFIFSSFVILRILCMC